jgi:thymidylate synthase
MGYLYQQSHFANAQNAFLVIHDAILKQGIAQKNHGTKALLNVGFYIENPLQRDINIDWRKWSKNYAEREWEWYMSENRSVSELKKYAPIWDKMHNGDDIVNSNYGFLWNEKNQLLKTIEQLRNYPEGRQSWITIFDGKNKDEYSKDTPCTLNLGFKILDGKLCMTVLMRSNDLWYGFCNDQYCFSKLQELIAGILAVEVGWYYHFSADLHLYQQHFGVKDSFFQNQYTLFDE